MSIGTQISCKILINSCANLHMSYNSNIGLIINIDLTNSENDLIMMATKYKTTIWNIKYRYKRNK